MVTRSDHNWNKHLIDVFNEILKDYGINYAQKFIDFYYERYETFGRSYLDYKLAFKLTDLYFETKRCGTRWIAAIGVGGAGKTTIMKNVFYYLDPTIKDKQQDRIGTDILQYLKELKVMKKDSLEGSFMDEPDDSIHPQSKTGKNVRRILGKQRQHGIFSGICATDVTDIPAYIWKKIHVLLFCPYHGQVWMYINEPRKLKFPIQKIRSEIMQYGYDLLVQLSGQAYKFNSVKYTPLDSGKEIYERTKWDDYQDDVDSVINFFEKDNKNGVKSENNNYKRDIEIKTLYKNDWTPTQLANKYELSRQQIHNIVKSK